MIVMLETHVVLGRKLQPASFIHGLDGIAGEVDENLPHRFAVEV